MLSFEENDVDLDSAAECLFVCSFVDFTVLLPSTLDPERPSGRSSLEGRVEGDPVSITAEAAIFVVVVFLTASSAYSSSLSRDRAAMRRDRLGRPEKKRGLALD